MVDGLIWVSRPFIYGHPIGHPSALQVYLHRKADEISSQHSEQRENSSLSVCALQTTHLIPFTSFHSVKYGLLVGLPTIFLIASTTSFWTYSSFPSYVANTICHRQVFFTGQSRPCPMPSCHLKIVKILLRFQG